MKKHSDESLEVKPYEASRLVADCCCVLWRSGLNLPFRPLVREERGDPGSENGLKNQHIGLQI
jgi:hypothetical protein